MVRAPLRVQGRAEEGGLAGAGFAQQERDAQRRTEAVAERGERFTVPRVQEEKRGFGVSWNGRSSSP